MKKFFSVKDNFKKIIKSKLCDVVSINQIATGWTNFVFDVKTKTNEYIFRFPRNNFFASVLEKEVKFTQFVKDKLTTKVADIKLFYIKGKPYTMHVKIKGKSLTQVSNKLSYFKKRKIAKQTVNFIYELQQIDIKTFDFSLPTTTQFLNELSKVDDEEYDLKKHDNLKQLEQQRLVLNHADLNPGNILVDDNFNVCAILDFAFVSVSSDINDISRLIGRLPKSYHKIMLKQFNKKFKTKVNITQVYNVVHVWDYVEAHYINYMKKNMPEIDIGR